MSSIPIHFETSKASLLRSAWDLPLIALSFLQGAILLLYPSPLLIALGMWWAANTIAHNFIHRPFFSARWLNRCFSIYLSLVLGIPQSLWRSRHLAHHADREWKLRITNQLAIETLGVVALWTLIAWSSPYFFLFGYTPGYVAGLCLCWLQGRYEHARGTTSHYGRLYNFLFFNDGYHLEHHARPGVHWRDLPHQTRLDDRPSRWPAVLRWLEGVLGMLERLVLGSRLLQQFVLSRHQKAFAKLKSQIPVPRSIGVVGGGLFPRSLIILKKLYPDAHIVGIEGDQRHIDIARSFVDAQFTHQWFDLGKPCQFDLLVIPLAYFGNRQRLYEYPPAPHLLIHDWLWRNRGR
ncbi:MAG TPA: fatty acid desaturase, partial [Tepidisphaeraceae bacterium]|nr:fatty acid desaturase [Tepidisphaeraceae bacterium]